MKKYIKIEIVEDENSCETITNIKGLKPYEIIGLLMTTIQDIQKKMNNANK